MKKIIKITITMLVIIIVLITWIMIDIKVRNNKLVNDANKKFQQDEDMIRNSLGTGYLKFQEVYWNGCTKASCITCIDGCLAKKINNVDMESFKILNDNYAADKNTAYYRYNVIKGSDPESFQVTDYSSAEDKNNKYKDGEKIN